MEREEAGGAAAAPPNPKPTPLSQQVHANSFTTREKGFSYTIRVDCCAHDDESVEDMKQLGVGPLRLLLHHRSSGKSAVVLGFRDRFTSLLMSLHSRCHCGS